MHEDPKRRHRPFRPGVAWDTTAIISPPIGAVKKHFARGSLGWSERHLPAAEGVMTPLFDHVDLRVSDFARVRPLYDALLPAMGFTRISEDDETICYYLPGEDRTAPFFGIDLDPDHRPNGTRIALYAEGTEEVDRLAEIARAAGATAFEPPHLCQEYSPGYYATFFEDADGNKLEICYRAAPEV